MDQDTPQIPGNIEQIAQTHERETLASLEETQARVVEEFRNAITWSQQAEEQGQGFAFKEARESLDKQEEEYARTIGGYLHAVGIQPTGEAFIEISENTFREMGRLAPELAYASAFREALIQSKLKGSITDENGTIQNQQGQRERFNRYTMQTVGRTLVARRIYGWI